MKIAEIVWTVLIVTIIGIWNLDTDVAYDQ